MFNHFLHHRFADDVLFDVRIVLRRQNDGVHCHWAITFVAQCDLAFCVWAQPRQLSTLTQKRLTFHQTVRVINRCGHQHVGFVGGITEHQPLIAGAQVFVFTFIDAHGDVGGLFANGIQYRAGRTVKTHVTAVVADIENHLAHQIFKINISRGAHLSSDDGHAGFDHGFNRNPCAFVFCENGIQHGVGYLIRHLVRVALGYRLRCEYGIKCHGLNSSLGNCWGDFDELSQLNLKTVA